MSKVARQGWRKPVRGPGPASGSLLLFSQTWRGAGGAGGGTRAGLSLVWPPLASRGRQRRRGRGVGLSAVNVPGSLQPPRLLALHGGGVGRSRPGSWAALWERVGAGRGAEGVRLAETAAGAAPRFPRGAAWRCPRHRTLIELVPPGIGGPGGVRVGGSFQGGVCALSLQASPAMGGDVCGRDPWGQRGLPGLTSV